MTIRINQMINSTVGLTIKANGNYLYRIRISAILRKYFNRLEFKKTYSHNINIFDVIKNIDIIRKEYDYIKRVVMNNSLKEEDILSIVNKFLVDNLNEDYEIRTNGGSGLVNCSYDENEVFQSSLISTTSYLLSDAKENLVNVYDESMIDIAKELLQTINIDFESLDDKSKNKLLFSLKQKQVVLLEKILKRNKNPHLVKRINSLKAKTDNLEVIVKYTLDEAIKAYMNHYSITVTCTEANLKEKHKGLEFFKDVIGGNRDIKDIKKSDIELYVNKYLRNKSSSRKYRIFTNEEIIRQIDAGEIDENKYSENTINKYYQHVNGFIKHLFNDGLIDKDIATLKLEIELENRDSFTDKDVSTMQEILKDKDTLFKLFNTYIYTGLRNEELWQSDIITLNDEVDNQEIVVFKVNGTKTKESNRIVPVHERLKELGINSEWLEAIKNRYINNKYLSRKINELMKANLENSEGKTLYSSRHYFVTKLKRNGVNDDIINKLVGHSNSGNLNNSVYGRDAFNLALLKDKINLL